MSNDFDNDFSWSDDDDNDNDLPDFEEDDDFDWSDSLDSEDGNLSPSSGSDEDDFDWLSDTDTQSDSPRGSDRLGVTGELSWLQSDSDDDTGSRPDDSRTGVTGELSWRESEQRAADFESMLDQAAAESGIDLFAGMDDDDDEISDNANDDDIPDWLRNVEPEEEDPEEIARQAINTDELFADFDTDFDDEEPAQPAVPATGELPDWLDDDSKILDETSPEWVKDIKATIGTGPLEDESVELDEPDWLDEVEFEPQDDLPVETVDEADSGLDDEFEFEDDIQPEEIDDILFADEELDEPEAPEEATDAELADLFDFDDDESVEEDEEGLADLLTVLEGDDDDFDLLGELSDDAGEEDLLSLLDDSGSDDFDLLDELDEPQDLESAPEAEALADDSLEAFDFGMDFEADDSLLEEEDEEDNLLEAAWLDEIDSEDLEAVDSMGEQGEDDFSDFLSSMDDDELGIASPLATQDSEVDFDTLFTEQGFEDLGEDEAFEAEEEASEDVPERPEWLQNVTVGDVSASALVRGQQDRPIEELSGRLQALHDAGLGLGTASGALSASEAIISTDYVATSISDSNEVSSALKVSPEQVEKANILRNIAGVTESTVQDKKSIQQRFRTGFNFTAVSVAILIFFAVLFPFSRGFLRLGEAPAEQFPVDSLQANMFTRIESLSAGDKVLFALEYGPTGAPELDDATSILALHTMSRNAVPIVVSTNPVGLLHGNVVINDLASNPTLLAIRNQPIANEDFFVSRYITAENIGLRNFSDPASLQSILSQNIDGEDITTGITSLDDFAYIIVIAESADSVRNWAEQVGSVTDTPLLYATGFATAPLASPYVETDSNSGFIYGLGNFLTYVDQFNASLQGASFVAPETNTPTPTEEPTDTATEQQTGDDSTGTPSTPEQAQTEEQTTPATEEPTAIATEEPEVTVEPTATPTDESTEEPTEQPTEQPTDDIVETATPEPTDPPTPTATATVQQGGLFDLYGIVASNQPVNVRGGPGTSFGVVGLLQPNERVKILGENTDGSWYQVELEGVDEAWIAAFLITLEINPGDSSYLPKPFTIGRGVAHVEQSDTTTDTETMTTTEGEKLIPEYAIENGELRWYSITFGLLIIIVIIIVGNLIGIIRDTNQRGK